MSLRIRKELVRFCAMLRYVGYDCVRFAGFACAHAGLRASDVRGFYAITEGRSMSRESLRRLEKRSFGAVLLGTFFRSLPSAANFTGHVHSGELLTYKIKKIFISDPDASKAAGFNASSRGRRAADCMFETGSECPRRTINLARDDLASLTA